MSKIKVQQRSAVNELLIIFVKLIFCITLIYFNSHKPMLYKTVPVIDKLAYSIMIFISASLSVSVIRLIIVRLYIRRNKLKSTVKDNFILGINQIVSVLNTVFVIISFMYLLGINPIKFLTSITIVAAAIALVSKEYIANMINGLIIMFSDKLSLGDHIKIGNEEGKILDITLVNVILHNEDNDMVLIPNSVIFNSIIINQSKQNIKKLNVEFEIDLSKHCTVDSLEQMIQPIVNKYKDFIVEDGVNIKTLDIKKDYARFKIQMLLKYHNKQKEREIRKLLNAQILQMSID